jgi:hypothetical protein
MFPIGLLQAEIMSETRVNNPYGLKKLSKSKEDAKRDISRKNSMHHFKKRVHQRSAASQFVATLLAVPLTLMPIFILAQTASACYNVTFTISQDSTVMKTLSRTIFISTAYRPPPFQKSQMNCSVVATFMLIVFASYLGCDPAVGACPGTISKGSLNINNAEFKVW